MRLKLAFLTLFACSLSFGCAQQNQTTPPKESDTVVFKGEDGRTLTLEELKKVKGKFSFEVIGAGDVPDEADSLHQQARELGGKGKYKEAIALLDKASALAPKWPYPVYDKAYTYLLMQEPDKARECYRKTVELSPRGYFTAITALDTLEREHSGELPAGTYRAYVSLEWIQDKEQLANILHQMVEKMPKFAPGWKELSMLEQKEDDRLAAIEKGLAAKPDAETKGTLLLNKAMALKGKGDREAAIKLLGKLALDPKSTLSTEHLAKATLALFAQ